MRETVKINLFDVFSSSGKIRTEEIEFEDSEIIISDTSYSIVQKTPMRFVFEAFEVGKIKLSGGFELVLEIPCDRCLEPVCVSVACPFDQILFSEEVKQRSGYDEEESFLQGNEFDVDEFVKMCVLMNMPSKVLCSEECRGLCPVCGNNLNERECGCDSFVPDPRMADLMNIFLGNKEV